MKRINVLWLLVIVMMVLALGALWGTPGARDSSRRFDPPGFGLVGMTPDQTLRVGISCSHIVVGEEPPDPCIGSVHFMDTSGAILKQARYSLRPGESAVIDLNAADVSFGIAGRVEIQPCWIPAEGRALPAVQLVDSRSGKTDLYINPVTPRLSLIQDLRATAPTTTTP